MILVADSGSSKTDWMGYFNGEVIKFNTQGINPYFLNEQEITTIISKNEVIAPLVDSVSEIYFFGAGCSSPDKHEVVSNGLSAIFKNAFILNKMMRCCHQFFCRWYSRANLHFLKKLPAVC